MQFPSYLSGLPVKKLWRNSGQPELARHRRAGHYCKCHAITGLSSVAGLDIALGSGGVMGDISRQPCRYLSIETMS